MRAATAPHARRSPQLWPPERVVEAARSGDADALAALVSDVHPHVRGFARSLCSTPQEAEDAAQEAMIVLFRQIGTLRATAALSSWLFRIVGHECIRQARLVLGSGAPPDRTSPSAESTVFARLETARLAEALMSLPAEQRAVVVLRDLQGYSGAATAAALNLSRPAMKSRLHRGRLGLKGLLTVDANFSREA